MYNEQLVKMDNDDMNKIVDEFVISDQWTDEEINSFKDLQPRNDEDFEWNHNTEKELLLNIIGTKYIGPDKHLKFIFLRENVSKNVNTYVSTYAIQEYIMNTDFKTKTNKLNESETTKIQDQLPINSKDTLINTNEIIENEMQAKESLNPDLSTANISIVNKENKDRVRQESPNKFF